MSEPYEVVLRVKVESDLEEKHWWHQPLTFGDLMMIGFIWVALDLAHALIKVLGRHFGWW